MCIALCKARRLDTINIMDFKTLATFFNLSPSSDIQQSIIELKKSISYIVLIERYLLFSYRNDLEQYLALPKFRRLAPYLQETLKMYCRELWELFNAEKFALQRSSIKEFQQSKTSFEKISQSYDNLRTVQKRDNSHMNFGYYPQFPATNSEFTPAQPINSYIYPYQNYMNNSRANALGSII